MVAICGEPVIRVREGQELRAWGLSSLKVPCEKLSMHGNVRVCKFLGLGLDQLRHVLAAFFRVWSLEPCYSTALSLACYLGERPPALQASTPKSETPACHTTGY